VSTHETNSDGDNMTASDDSYVDSETDGGYEAKNGKSGINYPLLEPPQETQYSYR